MTHDFFYSFFDDGSVVPATPANTPFPGAQFACAPDSALA
ncbi:hypothetical protein LT85_3380 [Collimonas arenae]|uniref:Uncharacterized protein n=1 Tax=Collimonas arenae TaxID=279058 RepID=A0A0A1FCQ0_9BURK|nr:hypothetical protein LT85_3380 [Collimonas arenae]